MRRLQTRFTGPIIRSLFLFLLSASLAAQTKVGTTAASFLGIGVGPRATALGGAFVAMSDDPTSLYYNPGAISRSPRLSFTMAHTNWLLGTRLNWIGGIVNLDGTQAFGVAVTHLDYGEEEVTTVQSPEGTGETWGASDLCLSLSYARNLTDRFSIGGSAKYVQVDIWHERATALALDVGLLFTTPFRDMRLGVSIANFGTDLRFDGRDLLRRIDLDPASQGNNEAIVAKLKTDPWPLPLFFRVGVAMEVLQFADNRMTLAIDAFRPSDHVETLHMGGEYAFKEWIFLRGGYKSLFKQDREEGWTAGIGLRFGSAPLSWSIDYTFMEFGILQDVHLLGIGGRF